MQSNGMTTTTTLNCFLQRKTRTRRFSITKGKVICSCARFFFTFLWCSGYYYKGGTGTATLRREFAAVGGSSSSAAEAFFIL